MAEGKWIGLDPTSGALERRDERGPARRAASLSGAVLGVVANGLGYSTVFMDALYAELAQGEGVMGRVRVVKPGVSVPPEPAAAVPAVRPSSESLHAASRATSAEPPPAARS